MSETSEWTSADDLFPAAVDVPTPDDVFGDTPAEEVFIPGEGNLDDTDILATVPMVEEYNTPPTPPQGWDATALPEATPVPTASLIPVTGINAADPANRKRLLLIVAVVVAALVVAALFAMGM